MRNSYIRKGLGVLVLGAATMLANPSDARAADKVNPAQELADIEAGYQKDDDERVLKKAKQVLGMMREDPDYAAHTTKIDGMLEGINNKLEDNVEPDPEAEAIVPPAEPQETVRNTRGNPLYSGVRNVKRGAANVGNGIRNVWRKGLGLFRRNKEAAPAEYATQAAESETSTLEEVVAPAKPAWAADEYTISFYKPAPISKMGVDEKAYDAKIQEAGKNLVDNMSEEYKMWKELGMEDAEIRKMIAKSMLKNKEAVQQSGGYEGIPGTNLTVSYADAAQIVNHYETNVATVPVDKVEDLVARVGGSVPEGATYAKLTGVNEAATAALKQMPKPASIRMESLDGSYSEAVNLNPEDMETAYTKLQRRVGGGVTKQEDGSYLGTESVAKWLANRFEGAKPAGFDAAAKAGYVTVVMTPAVETKTE